MIDSTSTAEPARPATRNAWLRLAALVLAVVAVGVPINHLYGYALLLIATVLMFSGRVSLRAGRWLAAVAVAAAAALLPLLIAPTPIEQGANVFLPTKPGNVFERQMPPDVYRFVKAEFDALYPPSVRCKSGSEGCWQDQGQPDRLYAFSADGVFGNPAYSRAVTGIDFSDPLWLRLGFVNDNRYNWYTAAPDVHRADRNREFWKGLRRWRTTMPWFVMYQFPADYAGSNLCWRGDVLWPSADGHYQPLRHAEMACRTLSEADVGRQIFAAAIRPGSLAMTLHPPAGVEARLIAGKAAALLAVIALLVLLVRVRPADTIRPFVLIGLALIVIVDHRRQLHRRLAADGRRRRRSVLHRHRPSDSSASRARRHHDRARRQRERLLLRRPGPALFPRDRNDFVRRYQSRLPVAGVGDADHRARSVQAFLLR